jgi:hypothetical protein
MRPVIGVCGVAGKAESSLGNRPISHRTRNDRARPIGAVELRAETVVARTHPTPSLEIKIGRDCLWLDRLNRRLRFRFGDGVGGFVPLDGDQPGS